MNTLGRLCDVITFYVTAPVKVLHLASHGDVVVAKTDPPMISVPVMIAAEFTQAIAMGKWQAVLEEVQLK